MSDRNRRGFFRKLFGGAIVASVPANRLVAEEKKLPSGFVELKDSSFVLANEYTAMCGSGTFMIGPSEIYTFNKNQTFSFMYDKKK